MNLPEALYTTARRYCIEQFAHWTSRYTELSRQGKDRRASEDGWEYTSEALATFPRYNILRAILVDIERLDPALLRDLSETKELLLLTGLTANDEFTKQPINKIDALAIQEEREAFCNFLQCLSESQLQAVEPLPYRRVFAPNESAEIWTAICEQWRITDHYWYPLVDRSRHDIEAFQDKPFYDAISNEALRKILNEQGIERVWELREFGPEYEEDLDYFEPYYDGAEGYWSSTKMDWIIYASHESSVTVGGWLLEKLKESWISWQEHVWTSPFF